MICHVSYANDKMSLSRDRCVVSALRYGCEPSYDIDIDETFALNYRHILEAERGAGYWLWKPHIINMLVNKLSDGDIIVYTDAGVEFINHVKHLVDAMDEDVFLFGNHYQHQDWCKREVFEGMGARAGFQVQASAMLFRVSDESKHFIAQWLDWCCKPDFINDVIRVEQYPEFREHRHDQAILTCLQQKYHYDLHWWPAMYNDGAFIYDKGTYMDTYPVIFHHHRKRNDEW